MRMYRLSYMTKEPKKKQLNIKVTLSQWRRLHAATKGPLSPTIQAMVTNKLDETLKEVEARKK